MKAQRWAANVNWLAFWRHRYHVLNLLNQMARGPERDAIHIVTHYEGSPDYAIKLHGIAREIIRPEGKEKL